MAVSPSEQLLPVAGAEAISNKKSAPELFIAFSRHIDLTNGLIRHVIDPRVEDNYVDLDLPADLHLRTR